MELTQREKDLWAALTGTAKSALSLFPVIGQAIAGYDSYKQSNFERNLFNIINQLKEKIDDINLFFTDEWLKTDEGQLFSRKVFDSALDGQLEDKQELFINALINGVNDKQSTYLEKLKFVDMLRHLSRASLLVLAEMHTMFIANVRGPNRDCDSISAFPLVSPDQIAQKLSPPFHPYLVTSAISEMESQGLFSSTGEWRKSSHNGSYVSGGGFSKELCYTDFTARFVEFVTLAPEARKIK